MEIKHPKSFQQVIAVLTRSFAELEAEALQESELAELSMKQLVYLDMISKMKNPTFSELAARHSVSKPSVTAIVAKLIQKGYVEKVQSSEDKRAFYILLTEKGRRLSEVHDHLHQRIAEHFSRVLNHKELQQLVELLRKVIKEDPN